MCVCGGGGGSEGGCRAGSLAWVWVSVIFVRKDRPRDRATKASSVMSASSCRRLRQPRVTYRGGGEGGDSRSVFKECVRGCVLEGVYEIGVQEKRAGTVPLPPADSAALMP